MSTQQTTHLARMQGLKVAGACNIVAEDWPYDCIAKDEHPDHTVYVCLTHKAWWHEKENVA